jgi:iron(III) transport system permease protein
MWLYLTLPVGVYGTIWILLIAYVTRFLPYGMRICTSGLAQVKDELREAAIVCGASFFRVFRKIIVPLLVPTMVSGFIYILLRSFREFPTSSMLTSYGNEVFSVTVYDLWQSGNAQRLAAYGVFVVILLSIIKFGVEKIAARYGVKVDEQEK